MNDRDEARLLNRLAGLRGHGSAQDWLEMMTPDIRRVLAKCQDPEAVVDAIMDTDDWRPTPVRISDVAAGMGAGPKTGDRPAACPSCRWTGWRHVRWLVEGEQHSKVRTAAARCDCPRGLSLTPTAPSWGETDSGLAQQYRLDRGRWPRVTSWQWDCGEGDHRWRTELRFEMEQAEGGSRGRVLAWLGPAATDREVEP